MPAFLSDDWSQPRDIRAVFLDVDGTLLNSNYTEATSSRAAVRRLREEGITTVISSGRPAYLLDVVDLEGFEGFVTLNGQYDFIEKDGVRDVFWDDPLDPDDVAAVVAQVEAGVFPVLFLEKERCYVSDHSQRVRDQERSVKKHYEEDDPRRALEARVYLLNAFLYPGEEHLLLDHTRHMRVTRWSDLFVDVMPAEGDKARGVRLMIDHLGLTPAQCVAFGDGENDLGMFAEVGTSVCMGNGYDHVQAKADFVTEDNDHDGVWNACVRLGLFDEPFWQER